MALATTASETTAPELPSIHDFVGRYAEKQFDWDAFPASRGFPVMSRAQKRYIGAGGAWEKTNDRSSLQTGHFTLSIVTKPPGKFAASHSHECVESFLGLSGSLTIGWAWGDEVIEAQLGYKDLCLNAIGRPHGFRNDGVEPALVSIMVGSHDPLPPKYFCHPKDHTEEVARHFGAPAPDKVHAFDPYSTDPHQQEFGRHIVRYSQQKPEWHPAGFARLVYIGDGGAPASSYQMDLIHLPKGQAVRLYEREVEDVYFVIEGVLTAGWITNGKIVEQRLGPKDLIFNPSGQLHYFRNDGVEDAQFMMAVGGRNPSKVAFKAA